MRLLPDAQFDWTPCGVLLSLSFLRLRGLFVLLADPRVGLVKREPKDQGCARVGLPLRAVRARDSKAPGADACSCRWLWPGRGDSRLMRVYCFASETASAPEAGDLNLVGLCTSLYCR